MSQETLGAVVFYLRVFPLLSSQMSFLKHLSLDTVIGQTKGMRGSGSDIQSLFASVTGPAVGYLR